MWNPSTQNLALPPYSRPSAEDMQVWSSCSSKTEPTLTRGDREAARKVRAKMGYQRLSLSVWNGARRYGLSRYIMSMFDTDAPGRNRLGCFAILLDLILARESAQRNAATESRLLIAARDVLSHRRLQPGCQATSQIPTSTIEWPRTSGWENQSAGPIAILWHFQTRPWARFRPRSVSRKQTERCLCTGQL
jgi:hypothetical protein